MHSQRRSYGRSRALHEPVVFLIEHVHTVAQADELKHKIVLSIFIEAVPSRRFSPFHCIETMQTPDERVAPFHLADQLFER